MRAIAVPSALPRPRKTSTVPRAEKQTAKPQQTQEDLRVAAIAYATALPRSAHAHLLRVGGGCALRGVMVRGAMAATPTFFFAALRLCGSHIWNQRVIARRAPSDSSS